MTAGNWPARRRAFTCLPFTSRLVAFRTTLSITSPWAPLTPIRGYLRPSRCGRGRLVRPSPQKTRLHPRRRTRNVILALRSGFVKQADPAQRLSKGWIGDTILRNYRCDQPHWGNVESWIPRMGRRRRDLLSLKGDFQHLFRSPFFDRDLPSRCQGEINAGCWHYGVGGHVTVKSGQRKHVCPYLVS